MWIIVENSLLHSLKNVCMTSLKKYVKKWYLIQCFVPVVVVVLKPKLLNPKSIKLQPQNQ